MFLRRTSQFLGIVPAINTFQYNETMFVGKKAINIFENWTEHIFEY